MERHVNRVRLDWTRRLSRHRNLIGAELPRRCRAGAADGQPCAQRLQRPDEPDVFPPPDAIIVAPATFNTVNKWAAGIADTLALRVVCEAIGKGLPLVVLPFLNSDLTAHPAFEQSVQRLRAWGVTVLYGPGGFQPHPAGRPSAWRVKKHDKIARE